MTNKKKQKPKKAGRPVTRKVAINATPEQITQAIFKAADKKTKGRSV